MPLGLPLGFAGVINDFEAEFEHSIMIVAFGAEEQGLVGSGALATRFAEEGEASNL